MGAKQEYPHLEKTDEGITILLSNNWKDENQNLFETDRITIPQGRPVCLVGCNGIGKTTVMEEIGDTIRRLMGARNAKDEREYNPFAGIFRRDDEKPAGAYYVMFDKDSNFTVFDPKKGGEAWGFDSDMSRFFGSMSSNGESLVRKLNGAFGAIGIFAKKAIAQKIPFFLFLDDVDAGTSIDVIAEIREEVNGLSGFLRSKGAEHYIVIASNSFELIRGMDCICVRDMSNVKFDDYDSYREFVLKTRKEKEKRDGVKK